jgi:hypothetical protein
MVSLDIQTKKNFKEAYFSKWDSYKHLTAFGKHLQDD